jgi:hypothetical protein
MNIKNNNAQILYIIIFLFDNNLQFFILLGLTACYNVLPYTSLMCIQFLCTPLHTEHSHAGVMRWKSKKRVAKNEIICLLLEMFPQSSLLLSVMTVGINFDLYHQRVLDFNHYNTGKIIIKAPLRWLGAFIFIVVSGGIECDVENIQRAEPYA